MDQFTEDVFGWMSRLDGMIQSIFLGIG
uniref:Uncharacterized protein n=1 Tax=Arundo donax TaxID=35708 RepID=A0A0A9CC16_ARUDO